MAIGIKNIKKRTKKKRKRKFYEPKMKISKEVVGRKSMKKMPKKNIVPLQPKAIRTGFILTQMSRRKRRKRMKKSRWPISQTTRSTKSKRTSMNASMPDFMRSKKS